MDMQIISSGMHMSPEFGLTNREIEKDGFTINRKIEMLLSSDTPSSISKASMTPFTFLAFSGLNDFILPPKVGQRNTVV